MLNPEADPFVPVGLKDAFHAKAGRAAVITVQAGRPSAPVSSLLVIKTLTEPVLASGASLPSPNGLAELAHTLSDNLAFEDMFDIGSRRNSLVELELAEQEDEEHEDFHDAQPAPADVNADEDASSDKSDASTNTRSSPMPITASQRATAVETAAAVAESLRQQIQEAVVIAKAQRDLLADAACVQSAAVTDTTQPKLGPHDFEILRVVGQGAFGKVFQVRARASGKVFAMKVMRKERILQKDHGDYVRAERDLLTAVVHPYIVTLRYSFQTASKLYLVLDFINGGHLFFNLYRQVSRLPVAKPKWQLS
eukprot:GHRR01007356.1.p1 GENE.GHRR01007356.1~~GHRR01007356.1.p1  ORF type:complete len:309 (+),score=95.71 GHRR01007356.1:311-1237(+)